MPAISKIRFTNVIYENGDKRYNDELFLFDGHNGAIVLENGGGKTVFIQTALQAIIPHVKVANRKMKDTLRLDEGPAHIAIEWILNERPRRYGLTCVTLFMTKESLDSLKYVYEYSVGDAHSIENLPFVRGKRPADKGEMQDYYNQMVTSHQINAHVFDTKERYITYIEENFHIVSTEWDSIVKINSGEGDVERFFDDCQTTGQLVDRLLIPNIEDAMAGFEANKFANSFESRLTSFQEYKHFQDKIGEYRKIQNRLDELTHHFECLEQKRQAYVHSKMKAKAYALNAEQQQADYLSKLQNAESALVLLEEEKNLLHHRKKSLEVAVEQEQLKRLEEELRLLGEETRQAEEKWLAAKEQLAQLQLAEQLQHEEILASRTKRLLLELEELDHNEESDDSLEQFKEIGQRLAGAFAERQEELEQALNKQQISLRQHKNLVEAEQKSLLELGEKIAATKLNERGESTSIAILKGDMDAIEKELLLEQTHLSMEEQQKLWVTEQTELDQKIVQLKNRTLHVKQLAEQVEIEREAQYTPLKEISTSLTEKRKDVEQLENEEQALIKRLQEFSMIWANLHSIHDRQESIDQSLQEELMRHHVQLEMLLADERSATRLYDDYKGQQSFFADAFLHEQLGRWRGQFTYLETGIEFVSGLDSDAVQRGDYPFWAMALVTKEKEALLLLKKIQACQSELQFPIHVLTLDEATAIVRGEEVFSFEWITPAHWSTSLDAETFRQWQEEIQQKAQATSVTRQSFSGQLNRWKSLQEAFQRFIHRYPLTYKQELQREVKGLHHQEFQLQQSMEKKRVLLVDYQREIVNNLKIIESLDSNLQGLFRYLDKAKEYLDKKRKKQSHEKTILYYREEITGLLQQQKQIIRNLEERHEDLRETEETIRETEAFLEKEVLGHPLFSKVKHGPTLPPQQSIKIVEERYLALERKVDGLLNTRQVVERELQGAAEQLKQVELMIRSIRIEYFDMRSDVQPFPSNGHEQMKLLTERIPILKDVKKNAEMLEKESQSKVDEKRGIVKAKLSEIENPLTFQHPLSIEAQELEASWGIWRQSSDSAKQEQSFAQKQMEYWLDIMRMLEKEAAMHQFLHEEITLVALSDKDLTDFIYNGEKRVKEISNGLKRMGQLYDVEQEHVDKERLVYMTFCRTTITDSRLQQTAVQGIESRSSYEDVLQYKQLLEKRLHIAEQYAEQHIHTHNKELELFLSHMSTHVSALRSELLNIPKTTAVKIDDGQRQVFHISIPEWQEDESKQLLRSHINWILARLDSQEYRSDVGEMDHGKVKNSLEKWLNSRQLLQVALQNKQIRISCHKVTNDNKISRAAYTWEESNSWSGGEKWSKNMSLFLGLLNYVAEKKQHIHPHMKRHRSVILDNPFGKASSGHVLTPVFFIAEQLGFQIITLTAHAEGKFLRDFFPVIYSCRLRQAVESDKQVMTTKKKIQSAFLRDLDPNSLERINQVEQIELFE